MNKINTRICWSFSLIFFSFIFLSADAVKSDINEEGTDGCGCIICQANSNPSIVNTIPNISRRSYDPDEAAAMCASAYPNDCPTARACTGGWSASGFGYCPSDQKCN